MGADATRDRPSRRPFPWRLAIAAAAALAAGALVLWWVHRDDTGSSTPAASGARAVSAAQLRAFAAANGFPVYWAGARSGQIYELSQTDAGERAFVRYLPPGVKPGDRRADFLTVGTYRLANAYAATQAAGRKPGEVSLRLPGGALAVYGRSRPTNVYVSRPGSPVQVEVFSPAPGEALQLVTSGRVVAVAGASARASAARSSGTTAARLVSPAVLKATVAHDGFPVYWAGEIARRALELTNAPGSRAFVRYLPPGTRAGDPRARFTTVATYAVGNGVAAVTRVSHEPGAVTIHAPGGAVAISSSARPTSVYVAFPGSSSEVEVFNPDPATARFLVTSGKIVPVG
jgi:hypothetical protein